MTSLGEPIRVVHVMPSLDATYGGPAQSVPSLSKALGEAGVDSLIYTVRGASAPQNSLLDGGAIPYRAYRGGGRKLQYFSPALRSALGGLSGSILHVHQILTYPSVAAFQVSRKAAGGAPLVCSLRSDLYEESLRRSAWKKKLAMAYVLRRMLNHAGFLHATEENEVAAVRRLGFRTPVAMIPNGIDVSPFRSRPAKPVARAALGLAAERRQALFLSRLHSRKGLHHLIEAFITLAPAFPDWDLLIVGPDHDPAYVRELQARVQASGLAPRVRFLGLLLGERKVAAYAAADLFVLPSEFENFGMSIAEALAADCPVITTDRTPWPQIETLACGWRVRPGLEALLPALRQALALAQDELETMGRRAAPALAPLSWEASAGKMKQAYAWMCGLGPRPDHVDI